MDTRWIPVASWKQEIPIIFLVSCEYNDNAMATAIVQYCEKYFSKNVAQYNNPKEIYNCCFDYWSPHNADKWRRSRNGNSVMRSLDLPEEYSFKKLVVHPNIIFLDSDGNRIVEEEKFNELSNA